MGLEPLMTDKTILEVLGHRLKRRRLDLAFTQAELAREAGVSKRTLERVEGGESTQTVNLIRILRVLDLLASLDAAIPATRPRPMELLRLKGKERQRVSSRKNQKRRDQEWSWGDEN